MRTSTRCGVTLVATVSLVLVSEVLMRARVLGFLAAVLLAALGTMAPVTQAAVPTVDGQTCMDGGGTVEYESTRGSWICVDGVHDGKPID